MSETARETDPAKLLESLLDITILCAGADSGYLILEKNGKLFIEAVKASNCSAAVTKTVPLEKSPELSKAVVRYVARTLEPIVLNYGEPAGIFARDPYIGKPNPRSIACLPLLVQGIPVGVLYLENSLMPRVFTPDRLQAVKLLSTQIAYAKKLEAYLEEECGEIEEEVYPRLVDPLTARETEVLELIAAGLSNKEIAARLEMTVNTVKTHIKNIYGKLQVNRRVQVVERAKRLGIL